MNPKPRAPGLPPLGFGGGFGDSRRGLKDLLPGRGKFALMALGTVMAVTFAMAWNPPTSSVHKFSAASDYRADRESGCTNSGEGCHGSEASYADFNAYHPEASCTTCHDYQGVGCIPCHSPRESECALCHDGSMRQAPDRVRITDPYPSGHYRETTHTAMGTSMDDVVRARPKGKAKATCSGCHSRDLRKAHTGVPAVDGSEYGPDLGCGECHNDVRSFGQAEVLSDWADRSCESCHKLGSSSPMHGVDSIETVRAEDEFGCTDSGAGCHAPTDLHDLHADKPKKCTGSAEKGEPGCHDLDVEAHAPDARACGGTDDASCHQSTDPRGYAHKKVREVHSPTSSGPASDRSFAGVPCGTCHHIEPDGFSLIAEHQRPTSSVTGDSGDLCADCHNNQGAASVINEGWAARDSDAACIACHNGEAIDSPHTGDLDAAHDSSSSDGCADTGGGCHPTVDISAVGDGDGALHSTCARCHDASASGENLSYSPGDNSCGEARDCHELRGAYDPKTSIHAGSGVPIDGNDKKHHEAGDAQMGARLIDAASGISIECRSCHSSLLMREHTRPGASIRADACADCHNASKDTARVVKTSWPEKSTKAACAACHDGNSASKRHTAMDDAHSATEYSLNGSAEEGTCSKSGCHGTADVRKLHSGSGCLLGGCHGETGTPAGRQMSCGGPAGGDSCHAGTGEHMGRIADHTARELDSYGDPSPGSCERAGCHATLDVRTLHQSAGCRTPDCHGDGGPSIISCGGQDGESASCHAGSSRHPDRHERHQATELDAYGERVAGTCQKAGCHATVDVRVLHKTSFCETAGCHVDGGPSYMSCGGGEGQPLSCHTGTSRHESRNEKHQAIEYGSDGSPTPQACKTSGCHSTLDVRVLHKTTFCETAGCHVTDGPTAMSCGGGDGQMNCHLYYDEAQHSQDHSADLSGIIGGVDYGTGENVGCLGTCHAENLVGEHRLRLLGGGLEGGGDSVCAICHASADGSGSYSRSSSVESAITSGDRRCVACHSGAVGDDGPSAVAAPPASCIAAPDMASIETLTTASAERAEAAPSSAPRKVVTQKPTPAVDEGDAENDTAEPTNTQPEPDSKTEDDGDSAKTDEDEPSQPSQPDCTRKADESSTATSISSVSNDADSCTPCHKVSD